MVDVFAMPQLGTGVSVEAVDPVFQVCRHKTCVCVPCDCFTLYTIHLLCCLLEKDDGHAHSDWAVSLFFMFVALACSTHIVATNFHDFFGVSKFVVAHFFLISEQSCVGWYHSHPGFGCWLSSVDVNTAKVGKRWNGYRDAASHLYVYYTC